MYSSPPCLLQSHKWGHCVVDEYPGTGNKENTSIRCQGFIFVCFLVVLGRGRFFCALFVGALFKHVQVLLFHITITITDGDDEPLLQ